VTDGTDGEGLTLPADPDEVRAAARSVLEANWRPEGYTVPNASVYPFQWLWDSCFHAITWADLGEPDRARSELAHLFRTQNSEGFVPHVDYEYSPNHHGDFWKREGHSSITQPPMFGHAIAELARRNVNVSDLVGPATAGLNFLFDVRSRIDGLIALCHPWESGGDDCPRWDHWCPGGWNVDDWRAIKGALVASVEHSALGSPIANPAFVVASCGFNALVAFNAFELATVTGDRALIEKANAVVEVLATRWDDKLGTWIDAGDSDADSGRVRSLDALLPLLVESDSSVIDRVFSELTDNASFGGQCGPAGMHRAESTFSARTYWRGPAWPQLTYLFWIAARRHGRSDDALALAAMLTRGAVTSSWAEYWDANEGTGLGAAPQSWAALAAVVQPR
jgi:hypothetical protein